jgi:hypothetical protein
MTKLTVTFHNFENVPIGSYTEAVNKVDLEVSTVGGMYKFMPITATQNKIITFEGVVK